ncbi:type I restriction-modification system subunit M [Aliarcobacter butzleri]|uniref:type I restriction-modification system subunit M n=1 Tax=Aliarcobacter butzleri TaxID=28197 RepID=UPI001EDAA07C|nr:type I restriction-modification system subunit M [Aliarcobacter butzleri]MCG3677504.1 type I restriction-modification system subunit M [Aliarcobacter butzleri]MDK2091596.1 type I restriction-modification system subunit M [Aliarcobacter butzleri]
MNKQQLAAKIWESANQMRSKIEANEYKDYILGFIFYKYLCDKVERFAKQEGYTAEDISNLSEEDSESVEYFKENLGFFISYDNLFSTWIKVGKDFDVSNVRDAMSAFNRLIHDNHKKLFDGIFTTLETGLSKLGENSASQTKAISSLIHLIKDIPMNSKQDYDVLGFIYEYLISMFAATAGKKAGEFYTPHEVSVLMSEIIAESLKDKKEIQIYDPTSGSGSLLINIGASVAKHMNDENNIRYYAQELKQNTYNLTRMNLVMRGIIPSNIVTRNADTLEEDWPYFDESDPTGTYNPLYIDAIVSNPPYSQKWDSENKESDPRYARFGLAPKTKADYAFLLHDLYHLKPDGIMTIVLPHGVLFRGGEEGVIRKNLIEQNHIDAIIGLPANIFFGTGIPTIIIVLKQKRENTDILIVDASKGFEKVGKNNKLRASDIKKIADTVINRTNIDKYSRAVSRDEIRENDYNLNIPRYVDSSEADESFDIYATMFGGIPKSEIELLNIYWQSFPTLKSALFDNIESEYTHLKTNDIKQTIMANDDVRTFIKNFSSSFDDFNSFLKTELLEQLLTLKIQKEQTILGNDIFKRLENIPLIDKYEAYQLLDDNWQSIATYLEIIQTEGFEATKQVDANIVIKKKNGKDVEVQEGWLGHIMPFDLVQNTYLKDELEALKVKEDRLLEITAQYEEILESLSEDEKEEDTVKESKDAFVNAEVVKVAKEIRTEIKKKAKFNEDSYELKILKVDGLISEEKALKKDVKEESEKLHIKTKKTIENLSDTQVYELLELKWIEPLEDKLYKLPNGIINNLVNKIQEISVKYETTLKDIENEIKDTSKELSSMLHELDGNEFDMQGLKAFQELLEVK